MTRYPGASSIKRILWGGNNAMRSFSDGSGSKSTGGESLYFHISPRWAYNFYPYQSDVCWCLRLGTIAFSISQTLHTLYTFYHSFRLTVVIGGQGPPYLLPNICNQLSNIIYFIIIVVLCNIHYSLFVYVMTNCTWWGRTNTQYCVQFIL